MPNGVIIKFNLNSQGREDDIRRLEQELHGAEPQRQARINYEISRIKKEAGNKDIQSMREALIRAHRSGNQEEIKDIHDYIRSKDKYHNY